MLLAIVIVFILIFAGVVIIMLVPKPVEEAQKIPEQIQQLPNMIIPKTDWRITEEWLDQKLVEWKDSKGSVQYGAVSQPLSYWHVQQNYITKEVIDANFKMLEDSGASIIRIDVDYTIFLNQEAQNIAKLDYAINKIKQDGKKVMLADSSAEVYFKSPKSWAEHKVLWKERVKVLTERYNPDYYVVIKEPGWYYNQIWDLHIIRLYDHPEEWIALTTDLTKIVKGINPQTQVAVAVAASQLYHEQGTSILNRVFLCKVDDIPIDILGFDIYDRWGFEDTERFINDCKPSKEKWILEAWSEDVAGDGSNIYNSGRENLDVKWVNVIDLFAKKFGFKGVVIFYTDLYAYYVNPNYQAQHNVSDAVSFYQGRSKTFYEVQKVARMN